MEVKLTQDQIKLLFALTALTKYDDAEYYLKRLELELEEDHDIILDELYTKLGGLTGVKNE